MSFLDSLAFCLGCDKLKRLVHILKNDPENYIVIAKSQIRKLQFFLQRDEENFERKKTLFLFK